MLTDARVNAMLDTEIAAGTKMSLHSAFSLTGANEVSGGSYARQTPTWNAGVGRSKTNSANIVFTGLPAAATVAFIGLWDSAGTTFKGMTPNGGSETSFQIDVTNNKFLIEGHGLANDDTVIFTGQSLSEPLIEGQIYYVINSTAADPDTFQISNTLGGSAINILDQSGDDAQVSKIVVDTYTVAGGTHTITSFTTRL